MFMWAIDRIGAHTLRISDSCGSFVLFLCTTARTAFSSPVDRKKIVAQMEQIGVQSLSIAILTGTFAGAVFAFQSYIAVKRFGGEEFVGAAVALALTRELSPVLTGLMVTGRAGSAIAAEIGTMRITEQIDALTTLAINPFRYLVAPRIAASCFVFPFLSLFTTISGSIGGYIVAVYALGLHGEDYLCSIQRHVQIADLMNGLIKSLCFGCIMACVGCYKGYHAAGGARGVGNATTEAVVVSSVLILLANYFLTAVLFN